MTGETSSTDFPTMGPHQPANAGVTDAFVAKLNPAGSALVYSTYLGGTGVDVGQGIAVDAAGDAYVTGLTASTDFPTMAPLQPANAGGADDVFLAKFDPAGGGLIFSTYLGGNQSDEAQGIALDSTGAYLTGVTNSPNFPLVHALQGFGGGNQDAFVAKVNTTGSTLVYSTYLGGSDSDTGYGIAVDSGHSAYVTGQTDSTNFPTLNPFQPAIGGTHDAFVSKLNDAGSGLVYSTYLGGTGFERGHGIAVDSSHAAYAVGETDSSDFPTASPFQPAPGGAVPDAYITKLAPAGNTPVYSSFLGGSGGDGAQAVAVDSAGKAFITGWTDAPDFPRVGAFQNTYGGGGLNAFVTNVNAAGSALVYSSYLGGSGTSGDQGLGIAVDSSGSAYLTGSTDSSNFPTVAPLQAANAGGGDAFVTKIGLRPTAVLVRSFSAERVGGKVVLRWRTDSEVGLLGFVVYREKGGTLVRLDRRLIPAGARRGVYRFSAPRRAGSYRLEAIGVDGSASWFRAK